MIWAGADHRPLQKCVEDLYSSVKERVGVFNTQKGKEGKDKLSELKGGVFPLTHVGQWAPHMTIFKEVLSSSPPCPCA